MKTLKILGIIALVAMIALTATSCVTATTLGGASGGHGLFSGGGAAAAATAGGQEIASYSVILGLFDSGYAAYADAVKKAEASGKKVTSTTKWYFNVVMVYTAYAH